MFLDLVDREDWPEYYEVIPEPRCLHNIQASIEKNRYKDALSVYTDLSLVFWNAMYYNDAHSQIWEDALALKQILEAEWKKRPSLPPTRTSPPPSSPQKVYGVQDNMEDVGVGSSSSSATGGEKSLKKEDAPPPPAPATSETKASASSPGKPNVVTRSSARQKSPPEQPPVGMMDIVVEEEDQPPNDSKDNEIVSQLEKSLPRWEGFGEKGWMKTGDMVRFSNVIDALRRYTDVRGDLLSVVFDKIPEVSDLQHLSYSYPLSLTLIETKVLGEGYSDPASFDKDMSRLFEKGRRYFEPATEPYGQLLVLQRLYQALTSANPPQTHPPSPTGFASLRAGPGNIKPVHGQDSEGVAGVTNHRVLTKDRQFVDEVNYKGWNVKLADWLHLSNPDDPSRPIIAQVFRCWISEEESRKGQVGVTVSWYYRPEQTFHPANRRFWVGEVFKTSHFAEHPLEDIVEKIACQFTARHIRGRPRPPFWYPGFPLYVCDSRYNDRDRQFVKIKNWNSCIPEEVRQSTEFMPIFPFERTVFPMRLSSPFLRKGGKHAVTGPGGIIDGADGADSSDTGPTKGLYVGSQKSPVTAAHQPQTTQVVDQPLVPKTTVDRTVYTAAGGVSLGNNYHLEKLPPETTRYFDRDPDTGEVLWFPAAPANMAHPAAPKHSIKYLHYLANKRKERTEDNNAMDVDTSGTIRGREWKRPCVHVPPTVSETLLTVLDGYS